jgi:hypothetical protein
MIILHELIGYFHTSHVFNPKLQQEKFHLFKNGITSAQVSGGHVFNSSKPCNTNMIFNLHLIGFSKANLVYL